MSTFISVLIMLLVPLGAIADLLATLAATNWRNFGPCVARHCCKKKCTVVYFYLTIMIQDNTGYVLPLLPDGYPCIRTYYLYY